MLDGADVKNIRGCAELYVKIQPRGKACHSKTDRTAFNEFLRFFIFQARRFDNKALKEIKRIAAPDALIRVKGGDPRANRIKPKILLKINKTGHNSYIIQARSTEVLKVKTLLR